MDTSVITAFAALTGAAMGGLIPGTATWLIQRAQAREQRLAYYQLRRQEVYKEFIMQASKLYIHALQNDEPDVSGLMALYAQVSRMRVLSSTTVVDSADQIVKTIYRFISGTKQDVSRTTADGTKRLDRPSSQF